MRTQALTRQTGGDGRRRLADLEEATLDLPWRYEQTETCYVLRGRFRVTPEGGEPHEFGRGDLITFPAGLSCTWEVIEAVEKHYDLA